MLDKKEIRIRDLMRIKSEWFYLTLYDLRTEKIKIPLRNYEAYSLYTGS